MAAIVVEDGSGLPTADSYISVEDTDLYHADRGNVDWDNVDDKSAVLRKATDYLEQVYAERWKGLKASDSQALSWPRVGAVALGYQVESDTVPDAVKRACAELALRASSEDLLADQDPEVASEAVGPISVSYFQGSNKAKRYPSVERGLKPFLTGGGSTVQIVRG